MEREGVFSLLYPKLDTKPSIQRTPPKSQQLQEHMVQKLKDDKIHDVTEKQSDTFADL